MQKRFKLKALLKLGLVLSASSQAQVLNTHEQTLSARDYMDLVNNQVILLDHNMALPSTKDYFLNPNLALASTFALKIFKRLDNENFTVAPYMPIPDKDMACYYGVPQYREAIKFDVNKEPINLSSDEVSGHLNEGVIYSGNVQIKQVDNLIFADRAAYNKDNNEIQLDGDITYRSNSVTMHSSKTATTNLSSHVSTLHQADFQLHGSVARGHAGKIEMNNEAETLELEDITFSTCPVGSRAWEIDAAFVKLDKKESFGVAHDSVLKIGSVPVFYFPYIKFPTSNKRQSGLLYPRVKISSSSGFDYAHPVYLNLATNYDATITPRIMTNRGVALDTEIRLLPFKNSLSQINFNYIPKDNYYHTKDDDKYRYFLDFKNNSYFLNNDLNFDIHYQKVRDEDYDYLSDIGAKSAHVTDNNLVQYFLASYNRPNFNLDLEVRNYQSLIPDTALSVKPFAMLPQIRASYYDSFDSFSYEFNAEATHFQSDLSVNNGYFNATRLHFEPAFKYQIFNARGSSLTAAARGFLTHYSQEDDKFMPSYFKDTLDYKNLDKSLTRALYMLEMRGKSKLERKVFDLRYTQTLEPEFLYQYIPYTDQSKIGLYDTTSRVNDYYSNFSFRRYHGIDRIADSNTLTIGLTSRLLDPHDRELYRFSVSQAYSFVPTRVTLYPNEKATTNPRSPLNFSFNMSPTNELTANANIVYVNETNEVSAWNAMIEYASEDVMAQINYRFSRDGNISLNNEFIDLSQLGLQLSLPINRQLRFVAAAYRDLEQNRNIDNKFALKYEDCCWALGLVYERYQKTDWEKFSQKTENIIGVEFEFKGLGKISMSGTRDGATTDTYLLEHFNTTNLSR